MGYAPGTTAMVMPPPVMAEWESGRVRSRDLALRPIEGLGCDFDWDAFMKWGTGQPFGVHWMFVHCFRRARTSGVQTGLITNIVREWGHVWRESIPDDLFDVVIEFYEVRCRKPDPEIYHLACNTLDVAPTSCVFVDDNPCHVEAAVGVGMYGMVMNRDPWGVVEEIERVCGVQSALAGHS